MKDCTYFKPNYAEMQMNKVCPVIYYDKHYYEMRNTSCDSNVFSKESNSD